MAQEHMSEVLVTHATLNVAPASPNQRSLELSAPNTTSALLTNFDHNEHTPVERMSATGQQPFSTEGILSPHAIPPNLVEPSSSWGHLAHDTKFEYDGNLQQDIRPRRSIAEKLGSMVERGWVGCDVFGKFYDDRCTPEDVPSQSDVGDLKTNRRSQSLGEESRLAEPQSHEPPVDPTIRYPVDSTVTTEGELCDSVVHIVPHAVEGQLKPLADYDTQQASHITTPPNAMDNVLRNSADIEPNCPNTATPRWGWSLHHAGLSKGIHNRQVQGRDTCATNATRRRSSDQDLELVNLSPSPEKKASDSGFNPIAAQDDRQSQRSIASSHTSSSRRVSASTNQSVKSASRSTSLFKKWPWYKVVLMNKDQVLPNSPTREDASSMNEGDTQHGLRLDDATRYPRDASMKHTLTECGHPAEVDEPNAEVASGQRAGLLKDVNLSQYFSPSLKLNIWSQGTDEQRLSQQTQKLVNSLHTPGLPAGTSETSVETLLEGRPDWPTNPSERSQVTMEAGPERIEARAFPTSALKDANSASESFGNLNATRYPGKTRASRTESHPSSDAHSVKPQSDARFELQSSAAVPARPELEVTAHISQQSRSERIRWSSQYSEKCTSSSSASLQADAIYEPVHREIKARSNGIKKVQVTVTFDGADHLVIEANLQKDGPKQ